MRRGPRLIGRISEARTGTLVQVALVVSGVLLHLWAMAGGFFHMDDFFYLADASRPFGDYVLQVYNGHLMPAGFALVWVSQALAPMSWALAVLITTGMWVVALLGVLAVMRRAFGDHPITWVALALVSLGPTLTTVTVWYASALQILPWMGAFAWMLYFAVRHAQDPRHRWWIGAVVAYLVGLAFWQKTLLALPVVLWLAWRFWPGQGRLGLAGLGRRWLLPLATGVVTVAYVPVYLALQSDAVLRSSPSASDVWESARIGIGEVLLTGFLGGPWGGFDEGLVPTPGRPAWAVALAWQLAVAVVITSVVRWRPAWNVWIILGLYSVVTVVLFAFGRIDAFGLVLVYDPRYIEDLYVVAAVALPFAFVRGKGSSLPEPRSLGWGRLPAAQVAFGVGLWVLVNALLLTSIAIGESAQDSPARQFVAASRASLAVSPETPTLDRKVPPAVMAPLFLERANASYVLSGLGLPINWNGSGPSVRALADDGSTYVPTIAPAAASMPGPDGGCGWRAFGAEVEIALDSELFPWTWVGSIEYLAAASGTARLALDGDAIEVPLEEGLHEVYFVVVGGGSSVTFAPPDGVGVCVSSIVLGQPEVS